MGGLLVYATFLGYFPHFIPNGCYASDISQVDLGYIGFNLGYIRFVEH